MTRKAARSALVVGAGAGLLFLWASLARSAGPSRKELLAALPEEDRKWLTDYVAPIILPEEEKLFLELTEPHLRERFQREFWARRERDGLPYPLGPAYEARYPELRRLADEVYDGWREDAGALVLRYGEPADVHTVRCEHVFRDLEVWTYNNTTIYSGRTRFFLYRANTFAPRKIWNLGVSNADIFLPNSCKQSFASLGSECPCEQAMPLHGTDCGPSGSRCDGVCADEGCDIYRVWKQIRDRQGSTFGAQQERGKLLAPEHLSLEGLDRLKDTSATSVNPNAVPLSVTGPSATVPAPAAAPAAKTPKKSKKELLADLPAEERTWLTEYVAPIILPEEEKLFLELDPRLRERFKREFWERRERDGLQAPLGAGYEGRYRELRSRADEVYDGWRNDAGQMVIRWGEPASIYPVQDCQYIFRDLEIWTYASGPLGSRAEFGFYRSQLGAPRRLLERQTRESDIFLPTSCRQTFSSLWPDCPESPPDAKLYDKCKGPVCSDACTVFHLYQRVLGASGAFQERSSLFAPAKVSLEGIDKIKDMSAAASDPNAKPLSVTGPSASVPAPASAPRSVKKKTKKELLADLPIEERSWLTEFVEPIIQPEEEQLFLELSKPEQFALFKSEFWNRRERDGLPFPMGPGYRGRYEELWRLAAEVYDGRHEDAGRMVMRYGEPASINILEGKKMTFRDLEIWTYRQSGQGQGAVHHFFYRKYPGAARKLWTYGTSESDVMAPGSCRKNFDELQRDCVVGKDQGDPCGIFPGKDPDLCRVWEIYKEIQLRQGSKLGAEGEWGRLLASAAVSTEGLDSLRTRLLGNFSGAPAPPPPLSRAERKPRKQLLAELPDEDLAWLTSFVAPIILKEEEALFLELTEGYQREIFKKDFWDRREVDGLGPPFGQDFKARYEELRPKLDSVYDGWRNDAAQLVLRFGEPSDIHHVEGCENVFRDVEIWTFTNLGNARGNVRHLLYRTAPTVPRKLWRETSTPLERQQGSNPSSYNEIFSPGSCRRTLDSLSADCNPVPNDRCSGPVCLEACDVYRVYQEERVRQGGSYLGGMMEMARIFKLPEISTEGLQRLRDRFATTANPNAKPLSVESQGTRPRVTPEPTPTPEPVHALTAEEVRDRIVHLEPRYRQFLDLAGPLMTEDQLQRFLQMTPKDKDRFMKEFWKPRS